jgi:hypothetical protein
MPSLPKSQDSLRKIAMVRSARDVTLGPEFKSQCQQNKIIIHVTTECAHTKLF